MQFLGFHAQAAFHQVIGFGNQLHQPVLDAIVHHFYIVAGRTGSQMSYTGIRPHMGCRRLQNGPDPLVGLFRTSRHQTRSVASAAFAAGDPHAHEVQSFFCERFDATVSVREMGVAAVDDQIAGFQVGDEAFDYGVHRLAGRHEQ